MRMDGEPDVARIGAHLDRKAGLGDEVSGVGADYSAPYDAIGLRIEQDLGDTFIAPKRERPAGSSPRKDPLPIFQASSLGIVLSQAHPCDFRVRIGDRWNDACVERTVAASRDLGG